MIMNNYWKEIEVVVVRPVPVIQINNWAIIDTA
jgi:hypothetical protein